MHSHGPIPFGGLETGARLGPLEITVSAEANERYWRAAGVNHPRFRDGALYPPIAANLTILLFQTQTPGTMIQTGQRIICHRRAEAGTPLRVTGALVERFDKRGREYATVQAIVADAANDEPIWTSIATFFEQDPARA